MSKGKRGGRSGGKASKSGRQLDQQKRSEPQSSKNQITKHNEPKASPSSTVLGAAKRVLNTSVPVDQGRLATPLRVSILDIAVDAPTVVRGTLELQGVVSPVAGVTQAWKFRETASERVSHDIRLISSAEILPGLYRVRVALRQLGQRHAAVSVTHDWQDSFLFHVDLESGAISSLMKKGDSFSLVQQPTVVLDADNWVNLSILFRLSRVIDGSFFLVLYATRGRDSLYYAGTGEECFEVGSLNLERTTDSGG